VKILITGTAGFIGYHLANKMCERGDEVIGLDVINDYYDTNLKYNRLQDAGIVKEDIQYNKMVTSRKNKNYHFIKMDINDRENLMKLFEREKFDKVCNLAAQAGVRYSIENPHAYITSNIEGFINILEGCRHHHTKHLVYASSSSVYGMNEQMPFSVRDNVDHPVSLYAASKKSNELMAHTYSHLYGLPTTGLRFFTVYGPWGRPDMALFIFTKAIMEDKPIVVYNYGKMERDFTYIEDIVEGVIKVIDNVAQPNPAWAGNDPDPSSSKAPYRLYNIGNNNPVRLMDFISAIEKNIGKKAQKEMLPLQPGDVVKTWANVDELITNFNYKPNTPVEKGVGAFVDWYRMYYGA
jgi:UDP-glucuronate 4-epimerase